MNELGQEVKRYLLNRIPITYDMGKQDLKYETYDIHYKIYKYIRDLEQEIKELRSR